MLAVNILRPPDRVTVFGEHEVAMAPARDGQIWRARDIEVPLDIRPDGLTATVCADRTPLKRMHMRWRLDVPAMRFLGDHWERGYGDLEWRGMVPERVMPFYFLAFDGQRTSGYGVRTAPAAMCWWQVDSGGVSLFMDLRSGGRGVVLSGRALQAATIVMRNGEEGERPFDGAMDFCRLLCDCPRLPDHVVYGSNNWYYAYGQSSHAEFLDDTRLLVDLAPTGHNRPYMVMDSGWQASGKLVGPWDRGNEKFPDMPGLAAEVRDLGARPGLWIRPLAAREQDPESLLLPTCRLATPPGRDPILDPTIPEVTQRVHDDVKRIASWGYDLIKHDYTTYDLYGHWGFEMGHHLTRDGWGFSDNSRTTAEIILDLYGTIREAAGDAVVCACNTVGHLAAGVFEIQRTGDDTSGREWERTRKMGINTLAFRMPQHESFFIADADCVGLTQAVPWALNRQWIELLADSGTALFVSMSPDAMGREQRNAVRKAFASAQCTEPPGEPLDWLDSICPSHWRLKSRDVSFRWYGDAGVPPPAAP